MIWLHVICCSCCLSHVVSVYSLKISYTGCYLVFVLFQIPSHEPSKQHKININLGNSYTLHLKSCRLRGFLFKKGNGVFATYPLNTLETATEIISTRPRSL